MPEILPVTPLEKNPNELQETKFPIKSENNLIKAVSF